GTTKVIPSLRLLILLLIGTLLIAGISFSGALLYLAIGYQLALAVLVVADLILTPRPQEIQGERNKHTQPSLGAEKLHTLPIATRSRQRLNMRVRDEYPYQFPSDALFLEGVVGPYELFEARYHLRPLQRGNYRFGDVVLRYDSLLGTFVRQARYSAAAEVKVY